MKPFRRGVALTGLAVLAACTATPLGEPPPVRGFLITPSVETPPIALSHDDGVRDRQAAAHLGASTSENRRLMAIAHAEMRPALARQHFDCAMGARLNAVETPALTSLMTRLAADVRAALNAAPVDQTRLRPMAADPSLSLCLQLPRAQMDQLAHTPARPSTQAALGAAWAGLMARIAPDRAPQLTHIGEELGLSAAVCNMDWMSDVRAGAALGRAVLAQAEPTPEFLALLHDARIEVAAARTSGLTNAACAAERAAWREFRP